MFQCNDRESSTGEPPTVPFRESETPASTSPVVSTVPTSDIVSSKSPRTESNRDSASNLAPQESDSGYEASPSSTNDACCTFSFEDGRPDLTNLSGTQRDSSTSANYPESEGPTELEDCSSSILMDFSEELAQEDDDCFLESNRELGENISRCPCSTCRIDNPRTSIGNEELECAEDEDCASCRDGRAFSLPIPIPSSEDSACRRPSAFREPRTQRLQSQSVPQQMPTPIPVPSPTPLSASRLACLHPVSWPTFRPLFSWWYRPSTVDTSANLSRRTPTPSRAERKKRRRLIDSDASSMSSSESEGPEEVFDEAESSIFEEEVERGGLVPLVSSAPIANGHLLLLSDGVRFTAPGSSNNSVRRSRSVSVNLPLERDLQEACHAVGQALRRLSDQFSTQMTLRRSSGRGRRYTIDEEIVRVSTFSNHNHRGGRGADGRGPNRRALQPHNDDQNEQT